MLVTHKIKIYLDNAHREPPPIDVMQGDANTRKLEIALYAGGKEWAVPDGVSVAVAYRGESGHGAYDTLPDGSKAYIVASNVVTVTLIPQVTARDGKTTVTVVFTDNGRQIATFGVLIRVAFNPLAGAGEPANYYNLREWASTPLCVELIRTADGAWVADASFDTMLQEHKAGRQILCEIETNDQQRLKLPLVEAAEGLYTFSAVSGGVEWTAEISRGGDGAAVAAVSQIAYAPVQPATDGKYFDITADGIISLKPEYRGASPAAADSASMGLSVSDNGTGLVGSRNRALPEEIIIPATVGGVAVTGYAPGMFYYNSRPRKITLLPTVAAIPTGFCGNCINLQEVAGTEAVRTIGQQGFAYSGITEIRLQGLTELAAGGSQFQCCANLALADLGGTITNIPKACFRFCEKLDKLEGCENVSTLGSLALFFTKSLKAPSFMENLDMEEVNKPGVLALMLSRANPTGFIADPGGNFTACATRMYSTFEQNDPRWAWKPIVGLRKYDRGCMYVSFAMMYSALEKQELRTPEEFVEMLFATNPDLAQEDAGADGTLAGLEHIAQTMADTWGHSWTLYREVTPAAVQAVYDALATTGKTKRVVVQARVVGDESGSNHAVVIYGINATGEVLVVDSESAAQSLDIYEAAVYAMPIQNLCRATDYLLIMAKED